MCVGEEEAVCVWGGEVVRGGGEAVLGKAVCVEGEAVCVWQGRGCLEGTRGYGGRLWKEVGNCLLFPLSS